MRVLYQIPNLDTIYAGRTIYNGYKNAFIDMGHQFSPLTSEDDFDAVCESFRPDIFITSLSQFYLKFLDLDALGRRKRAGLKVFVNVPFWKSPMSKLRINETSGLSSNDYHIGLIKSGEFGDVYFNSCEQDDERMAGFGEGTGHPYFTIPLAADKTILFEERDERFLADISYIGTFLPEKRKFFREIIFPLRRKYTVRLYGQDWTFIDRLRGFLQKIGQYFNLSWLRLIQKPKMELEDERKVYASSMISVNVHEEHQKRSGGDCNERTFKIPLCGGFEIVDDVDCIKRYFKEGEEMVIARDRDDWLKKIAYYIENPEERRAIIEAGKQRVLREHTYHNRVEKIIGIFNSI